MKNPPLRIVDARAFVNGGEIVAEFMVATQSGSDPIPHRYVIESAAIALKLFSHLESCVHALHAMGVTGPDASVAIDEGPRMKVEG